MRGPLWNDELYTLLIPRSPTMSDVRAALATGADQVPPPFQIVTRASLALFGMNRFEHLRTGLKSVMPPFEAAESRRGHRAQPGLHAAGQTPAGAVTGARNDALSDAPDARQVTLTPRTRGTQGRLAYLPAER